MRRLHRRSVVLARVEEKKADHEKSDKSQKATAKKTGKQQATDESKK